MAQAGAFDENASQTDREESLWLTFERLPPSSASTSIPPGIAPDKSELLVQAESVIAALDDAGLEEEGR